MGYIVSMLLCLLSRFDCASFDRPLPTTFQLESTESDDPVRAEKECIINYLTVGHLEYRVWREEDALVARCDLSNAAQELGYKITWMKNEDLGFRKVLHLCDFLTPLRQDVMSCSHRLRLPLAEDGERISCLLRAYGRWGTEVGTGCSGDEVTLKEAAYRLWKNKSSRRVGVQEQAFTPVPLDGKGNLKRPGQMPEPWHPGLIVEIPGFVNNKVCPEGNRERRMKVDIVPHLEYYPPSITYTCTLEFFFREEGKFTVRLVEGNASDPYFNFGVFMKQCKRDQETVRKHFKCEVTMPITYDDVGSHIYFCEYRQDDKVCKTDDIFYNITTEEIYRERMKKVAQDEKEGKNKKKQDGDKKGGGGAGSGGAGSGGAGGGGAGSGGAGGAAGGATTNKPTEATLPWGIGPMQGPGMRLNGKQYMIMGIGAAGFLATLGCLACMLYTGKRKREELARALTCYCTAREKGKRKARKKGKSDDSSVSGDSSVEGAQGKGEERGKS